MEDELSKVICKNQEFKTQNEFDCSFKKFIEKSGAFFIIKNSNGKTENQKWKYLSVTLRCENSGISAPKPNRKTDRPFK